MRLIPEPFFFICDGFIILVACMFKGCSFTTSKAFAEMLLLFKEACLS
jgi:hypothetical protein